MLTLTSPTWKFYQWLGLSQLDTSFFSVACLSRIKYWELWLLWSDFRILFSKLFPIPEMTQLEANMLPLRCQYFGERRFTHSLGFITYRFSWLGRQLGTGLDRQDWGKTCTTCKGRWVFLRLHVWVFAISKHFAGQLFQASWGTFRTLVLPAHIFLAGYLLPRKRNSPNLRYNRTWFLTGMEEFKGQHTTLSTTP